MKYWVITDSHFGHNRLNKFEQRKDNWENILFNSMKNQIKPEDTLIHLGDVSFTNHEYYHRILTSFCKNNILCHGNHEKESNTKYYSYSWNVIVESFNIKIYGKNIIFSHKPVKTELNQINIHGHFHKENLENCFNHEPELKQIYTDRNIRMCFSNELIRLKSIIKQINKGITKINF